MTPPPFIRIFSNGSSHPRIGEAEVRPAGARLDGLLRASREQGENARRSETAAIDQFLVAPTLRYRGSTADLFRQYDNAQMESFVPILLAQARGGHRLSYFNLLQLHYGLLDRAEPARIPALSQRISGIAMEYVEFLRSHPEIPEEEKMRSLYAGARVLHTYLAYLLNPPRADLAFADREATLNLLFSTLDSMDAELQGYHAALRSRGIPDLAEYEGVSRMIALRRRLRQGSEGERRQAALDLAEELTQHPPPASDDEWQARAERTILEMPNPIGQLQAFDRPSPAEERAAALNALALETLEVAAATLDRCNEESEGVVLARSRDLGLVLSIAILRHPEQTLEELLQRLQNPASRADFVQEISQAHNSVPALAAALNEALRGRTAVNLAEDAHRAALHVGRLQQGLGAAILPGILEENRDRHPIRHVAEALARLPLLIRELHLAQAGSDGPSAQRQQAAELLRRRERGVREIESFRRQYPQYPVTSLHEAMSRTDEIDEFSTSTLDRLASTLDRGRDHEIAASQAVFSALDREAELAPGLRLSAASRQRARALRERVDGFGYRAGRVVSHLTSSSSLLGLAAGILATEFLPTLLIARAGLSGSLALGRMPLVSAGALSWQGSVLTGLGTGLGMSLIGSSLHQWELQRQGLETHWGRDLGTSLLLNSVTFGSTMLFSRWLNRALTPRFDATTPLAPLSAGRRLLLHGSNVAVGGLTSFGLGYLGRGALTGQWRTSPEEAAENFGSILLWEAGAAGIRGARRLRGGYSPELGPYRRAEVERLTGAIVEMHPGLADRRANIQNHLAREEALYPGWIRRFRDVLKAGGRVPILEGQGRSQRLLLVPESSLPERPAPLPAQSPPVVIFLRNERERPALTSAGSESNESLPPPPAQENSNNGEPSATERPRSLPPLVLGETPHYFAVQADGNSGEPAGTLNLSAIPEGNATWILGRSHFLFLSPQAGRTISRNHLEIRRDLNGRLWVRDLSADGRQRPWGLRWQNDHGTFYLAPSAPGEAPALNRQWLRVPSDQFLALENIESLGLGNVTEPVVLGLRPAPSPAIRETLQVDTRVEPTLTELSISMAGGQRRELNGLRLLRNAKASTFMLAGSGGTQLEITRSRGANAGQTENTNASMNPIVGEIGETTRVVVTENGRRQEFDLHFDDPDLPAAHLPEVGIEFHGNQQNLRFRPTEAELAFGKLAQPELFQSQWISRRHFSLRVVTHLGQPRYLLTADSRFGLVLGNRHLRPTESVLLYAGNWDLGFSMNGASTAVDGPLRLSLPPIESVFPEWRTEPLLAGHDRGIAPPPPPPPPPPPLPPRQPEPPTGAANWIQRLWQEYFGGRRG